VTIQEHMANSLRGNLDWLKNTVSDFSDAELLVRPVPSANTPQWQIGHLINTEARFMSTVGAKPVPLPAGFEDAFTKETAKIDSPTKFNTKAELFGLFDKIRAATIAWVSSATPEQLAAPSPERIRAFAPTTLDLVQLNLGHVLMHMGQIQVVRRKLGKPVMF